MNVTKIVALLILFLAVMDWLYFIIEKDEQKKISISTRAYVEMCLAILVAKLLN